MKLYFNFMGVRTKRMKPFCDWRAYNLPCSVCCYESWCRAIFRRARLELLSKKYVCSCLSYIFPVFFSWWILKKMISGLEVGLIQKRGVSRSGVVGVGWGCWAPGQERYDLSILNDKFIVDNFWLQFWIHLADVPNLSIYIPYPLNSQSLQMLHALLTTRAVEKGNREPTTQNIIKIQ